MRGIKVDGIRGSLKEPIILIQTASGCWEDVRHVRAPGGYGRIRWDGKSNLMHRFMYAYLKGPIPPGMQVCHQCDNRACVNPDHLFLDSSQGNTADRHSKGRTAHGSIVGTSVLTEPDVQDILKSSDTCTSLAKRYGVSKSIISRIKLRKSWKHVGVAS